MSDLRIPAEARPHVAAELRRLADVLDRGFLADSSSPARQGAEVAIELMRSRADELDEDAS